MKQEFSERKAFAGFVPHRLEIEGRTDLSDFPQNIVFANFFAEGGVKKIASAIYEPDLETYAGRSLTYRNIYNPENVVRITRQNDRWEGTKVINGDEVLFAEARTWKQFFVQLTIIGLSKGERCKFEDIDSLLRKYS